jgi:hypothetical protein
MTNHRAISGGTNNMPIDGVLLTIASVISIGFGVWHFFVPMLWNWYSYIDSKIYFASATKEALLIPLIANLLLWIARVIMQILFPQGSANVHLRNGTLGTFIIVACCYAIPLMGLLHAGDSFNRLSSFSGIY